MLSPGSHFGNFIIGQKIGQGAFGEIYSSIDTETGIIWVIKTESSDAKRKTLYFEYRILSEVQSSPYFPHLGIYGKSPTFTFYSMEFLGPSISNILHYIPSHRFSFSTSIRTIYHILKGIEALHNNGIVHRDIKPGNILIREGTDTPICIIDLGLAHVFVDINTGVVRPPRSRIGFRGTKAYASIGAHLSKDLGRRDDLISWFYLSMELLTGNLPWRGAQDKNVVIQMKENYDVRSIIGESIPEMVVIWEYVSTLKFEDTPNYSMIYNALESIIEHKGVYMNEPYDWAGFLHDHRKRIAHTLEEQLENEQKPKMRDIQVARNPTMLSPLLKEPFSTATTESVESSCCC